MKTFTLTVDEQTLVALARALAFSMHNVQDFDEETNELNAQASDTMCADANKEVSDVFALELQKVVDLYEVQK